MSGAIELDYLFIRESSEVTWVSAKLDRLRPIHGSCELNEMAINLHGAKVVCLRIDVAVDDSIVKNVCRARVHAKALNINSASPSDLVNEVVAAVYPKVLNYDVSDHTNKEHYTTEALLGYSCIDVTNLVIPKCVSSFSMRASSIIGFDITRLPANVKQIQSNALVTESQVNGLVKEWQNSQREIVRFILVNAQSDALGSFRLDQALDGTKAVKIFPEFMLRDLPPCDIPPCFAVDRDDGQRLVIMLDNMAGLVFVGPGNPAIKLFKDLRTPRR